MYPSQGIGKISANPGQKLHITPFLYACGLQLFLYACGLQLEILSNQLHLPYKSFVTIGFRFYPISFCLILLSNRFPPLPVVYCRARFGIQ